jgi:hypothetical protein
MGDWLTVFPYKKKKAKNERYTNFTFGTGCVDFFAGVAIAAHGRLHLSEASLSGGQEGKNCGGKRSETLITLFYQIKERINI